MSAVTREHLDAWLAVLAEAPVDSQHPIVNGPYSSWDLFPRIQTADFDPRLAGDASAALWWTAAADAAFDAAGVLTRPMLLHWQGERTQLQLTAAQADLPARFVDTAPYSAAGVAILSAQRPPQPTDLARLLAAFAALRAGGCVALERAGWTQSDGWTSVAETQRHPRQTAVFWNAQSQDNLDDVGMLQGTMYLYWRGDAARIGRALEQAGLTAALPADEHAAVGVSSLHPVPAGLATVADAQRHEHALPQATSARPLSSGGLTVRVSPAQARADATEVGYPVVGLWPAPDGRHLGVVLGGSRRGSPERWLWMRSAETLRVAEAGPALPDHAVLGTLAWLSPSRLLVAWVDYRAEQDQRLVLSEWAPDGETREILRLVTTHPGERGLVAAAPAAGVVVLPRPRGATVRRLGAAGTVARQPRPGVRVRRAQPHPSRAWEELTALRDDAWSMSDAYSMVACSPDGATVVQTADGAHRVVAWDRDSGALLWTGDPMEKHIGSRGTRELAVSPDGALVWVRTSRGIPGTSEATHHTVLFEMRTGARTQPTLEAALVGATAVALDPSGVWVAAGMADGHLRLLRRADGVCVASLSLFAHGGISAVAWQGGAAGLVAGSSRGELCRLDWTPQTV